MRIADILAWTSGREASTGRGACLSVSPLLARPAGWRSEEKIYRHHVLALVRARGEPAGLRVGGGVSAHLPSGNGHDGRVDTTSTSTRAVQENSNVQFNIDWEVAEPPAFFMFS